MPRADKTLDQMRTNPHDWRIASLARGAQIYGGRAAASWFLSIPPLRKRYRFPARRPIKPVYVRRFVAFFDAVRATNE